ncbi:MAG: hypothetical protein MUC86_10435 [Burkholderiaceae bacterium]|nr:hypothetical protein [Burkholderiaceae bacterium]
MIDGGLQHRLVAILTADAAGHSRLMSIDDKATVATLDAARAVFRTQVAAQRGRIIDMAGDSVLAVFGTATDAVNAALSIQARIHALAEAAPEDRRMRFRIGVLSAHDEAAMCLLLLGEPNKAPARVARIDGLAYSFGGHHAVTALAHLALGSVEVATRHIRDHALEGASGKASRQCNDSLLLLAQLAHAEGDCTTAVDRLSKVGRCRSPSTIQCARVPARKLGVAEQHARNELECMTAQSAAEHGPLGVRRAMAALHEEIGRRGWA